jgi:hypothetical protein
MKQTIKTNADKLKSFKGYVIGNKNKITYKTYVMFNSTCTKILNDYLTTCEIELLFDLKEHTMFLGTIYKYISENNPSEEYLPQIKEKFAYYKSWIISQSDMDVSN